MAHDAVVAKQMSPSLRVGIGSGSWPPALFKRNMLGILRALQTVEVCDEVFPAIRSGEEVAVGRHERDMTDLARVDEVSGKPKW